MAEKTLGQVAYEAIGPPTAPSWNLMYEADQQRWQAVADAVIAEYEARRWRAIESAPKDEWVWAGRWWWNTQKDVWVTEKVLWLTDRSWHDWTHWTPIPAPPKEAI